MINKAKFYLWVLLIISCLFVSCDEDKGNYDYAEINEAIFEGIETEYIGTTAAPFEIIPTLKFTQDKEIDDARYKFEWVAINESKLILDADKRTDLADTKNLQLAALNLKVGNYEVFYRVTDVQTGVQWSTSFKLKVENGIYEGWMIMCDVNGTARLDMISKIKGNYTPIYDVLYDTGSALVLKGKPVNVYCYELGPETNDFGIYVTSSGTGTTRIHPDTFDWLVNYYLSFEMVSAVPTDFAADFIVGLKSQFGSDYESLMYKNGDVYHYNRSMDLFYGIPINIVYDETEAFKAAPFIAIGDGFDNGSVLYDDTNKRFVSLYPSDQRCEELEYGDLFDYNTGMDLLYMSNGKYIASDAVYAILKNPTDSKVYLAIMDLGGNSQLFYEEIPVDIARDISQSDYYAVNPDFNLIFYNVGSKVYGYSFGSQTSRLMLDKGSEAITLMKFDSTSPYDKELVVATYNNAANKGTFEIYQVPGINANLVLKETYTDFGKIVSAAYRFR